MWKRKPRHSNLKAEAAMRKPAGICDSGLVCRDCGNTGTYGAGFHQDTISLDSSGKDMLDLACTKCGSTQVTRLRG